MNTYLKFIAKVFSYRLLPVCIIISASAVHCSRVGPSSERATPEGLSGESGGK